MSHDDRHDDRHDHEDDRDPRLDLAAWEAPPAPPGLVDRVLGAVSATPVASAREPLAAPPAARRAWPRTVAVALASAAVAAAATAALLGRGAPSAVDVTITPTADSLEVTSARGARIHVRTPLGVVETGPAPARFALSPATTSSPSVAEDDMQRKTIALAGGAALLAAGLAVVMHEGQGRVAPAGAGAPAATTAVLAPGQSLTLAPATATGAGPRLVARATKDRALRDEVAAAIARTRSQRVATGSGSAAPPAAALGAGAAPSLSKDAVRTGVREVIPMLADCYQQELLDRGVKVEGKLVAHLVVEGEPELGTVVSADDQRPAELDFHGKSEGESPAAALLDDAYRGFSTCVEATLESVVLPPLPEGDRIEITYPFAFAYDDDDEAPAGGSAPGPSKPPTPPPTTRKTAPTASELLAQSQDAAGRGTWVPALALAEQALTASPTEEEQQRAHTVAALAACNLRQFDKARRHHQPLPPSRQGPARQACLRQGVDLALAADAAEDREPATTRLERARQAIATGQWAAALALAQELRTEAGDPVLREQATYLVGVAQCNLRQWAAARRSYDALPKQRRDLVRIACLKNGRELEP